MTKKNYIAIAEILNKQREYSEPVEEATLNTLMIKLAHYFKEDNPSFKYDVFYEACGFKE